MGAPSTGKTTLCKALAEKFETKWMPEYGREYWEKHHTNRRLTPEQLVDIAEGHVERENELLKEANRFLFVDTNAITTYIFALYYHQSAHPRLEELAKLAETRYDRVFLCNTDIPYNDTWCRSGEANREDMQRWTVEQLTQRKIPYVELPANHEERIKLLEGHLHS